MPSKTTISFMNGLIFFRPFFFLTHLVKDAKVGEDQLLKESIVNLDFEERLAREGLHSEAIDVAVVMTRALCPASTEDEAIIEACQSKPGSDQREAALLVWRHFSAAKIKAATTPGVLRQAYFNAHLGKKEKVQALRRWIDLAATSEEIREVYWETEDLSEEQKMAGQKLLTYFESLLSAELEDLSVDQKKERERVLMQYYENALLYR